jgi:hypothetical protein
MGRSFASHGNAIWIDDLTNDRRPATTGFVPPMQSPTTRCRHQPVKVERPDEIRKGEIFLVSGAGEPFEIAVLTPPYGSAFDLVRLPLKSGKVVIETWIVNDTGLIIIDPASRVVQGRFLKSTGKALTSAEIREIGVQACSGR